jgi:hypothetical protein
LDIISGGLAMPTKHHKPEQIIAKLRQIEVISAQGKPLAAACKEAGISEQSYYRWKKEYGSLKTDQAKKLKDLERENKNGVSSNIPKEKWKNGGQF